MSDLWTTGLTIKWHGRGKWTAGLDYQDSRFCDETAITGWIGLKYQVEEDQLPQLLKALVAQAERMGVVYRIEPQLTPTVYMDQDGEGTDPQAPHNWRDVVHQCCDALGWRDIYEELSKGSKT